MDYDKLTLIFDIDGTLCPIKKENEKYEDLIPNEKILKKIIHDKQLGAKIILYTSRNMRSYNGNIGLINANTAKVLLKWLDKWNIPYDEIIYGKPWCGRFGFYVDDKAVRPNEYLKYTPEEIMEICNKSNEEL